MAKSVMAVTLAGVITAACVAVGSDSINSNGTDINAQNIQTVTAGADSYVADETSQMTGSDAKGAFTTEDLGISASDYTDDEQIAKAADTIANADAQNIVNTQFELIPVEKLAITADTSSENEVMGGRKEYIDNGGAKQSAAVKFAETPMYVYGVDVSKWQGDINWAAAKASGISFAMIKCAGRSTGDGSLYRPLLRTEYSGGTVCRYSVRRVLLLTGN